MKDDLVKKRVEYLSDVISDWEAGGPYVSDI